MNFCKNIFIFYSFLVRNRKCQVSGPFLWWQNIEIRNVGISSNNLHQHISTRRKQSTWWVDQNMGERIQIWANACDNHKPLFHWNDNCIKYINKFHKQQHWHSYPLSFPIISWNCPGNFCESSVITLLICFLVHSVQGGGHLPARTSGARTENNRVRMLFANIIGRHSDLGSRIKKYSNW